MKTKFLMMALLLSLSHLNAGVKVGNGGDGVVCFQDVSEKDLKEFKQELKEGKVDFDHPYFDQISSVQLLDLYELQKSNQKDLHFKQEDFDHHAKIFLDIEKKLTKINLDLAIKLYQARDNLMVIVNNVNPLMEIEDEGVLPKVDKNCLIMQLADQKSQTEDVNFNGVLFDRLSKEDQTILYLHEYVYYVLIKKYKSYHVQGNEVRSVVRFLISKDFMERNSTSENILKLKELKLL